MTSSNKMTALEQLEAIVRSDNFEARVRTLRAEAVEAGDRDQVSACDCALVHIDVGNPSCLDCAEALRSAEASA